MPLIRCTEQKSQTLEEFYRELIPDKVKTLPDLGTPMLKVLKLINETFRETTIYGLTSHSTLVLLDKDSSLRPWYVSLNGIQSSPDGERNEYHIEYLMPRDKQPWPGAKIKGGATSLEQLRRYIVIAMTESNGWTESEELDRLYQEL